MHLIKRLEISAHAGAVYTVDGHGHFVYTGSGDQFVAKWNLETGLQEKFSIRAEKSVYKILLIEEGQKLVIGTSAGALHIIDLAARKEIKHFVQHTQAIFSMCENRIKKHLYSGDASGNLAVWNTGNWELILFLPLECGKIRSVTCDESGNQLFLACQSGEIKIFDTATFNETASFFAHENGTNTFHLWPGLPSTLLSAGKDGYIRAWNLESFEKIIEIPAHNFGIYQLAFLNDGQNFVSVSRDKSIKLWDSSNFKVLQKIERKHGGHSHAVNAIYKKSENEFVTVGDDKRIIHWELSF
ncbi:MAG: hypothetical protein K0R65_582 [Crocinitomicaceae bacterium]|jgi:WD40 repeat protein|nr:hypothetical protein [Crocinitomicaceae bacterium]